MSGFIVKIITGIKSALMMATWKAIEFFVQINLLTYTRANHLIAHMSIFQHALPCLLGV